MRGRQGAAAVQHRAVPGSRVDKNPGEDPGRRPNPRQGSSIAFRDNIHVDVIDLYCSICSAYSVCWNLWPVTEEAFAELHEVHEGATHLDLVEIVGPFSKNVYCLLDCCSAFTVQFCA